MNEGLNSRHIVIFTVIAFLLAVTVAAASFDAAFRLLLSPTTTASTGSPSGMEFINSNGPRELSLVRGCADGQLLKAAVGGNWSCSNDLTTAVSGAAVGAVALDLGNNGSDESASLIRIAVTGDTNSIFTEPTPDKLLITVSNAWPAATALAANGANCSAGSAPLGVDTAGAAEGCFDVEEEAQLGTTNITGNAADDQVLLGTGASAATWKAITDCVDAGGNHLNYTAATNTFSCGTSGGGSGYATVQEEGVAVTARAILNFIGGTITCVDNPGSVRTDCTVTAGGSTNSFETWNTTSGTAPVADSATDTMTLTAGTNISIIGDSAADSITIGVTGSVAKATALAANGANCSAGSAPLGVDTAGAAEGCFDVEEEGDIVTTTVTGNAADDQVLLGTAASAATWTAVSNCTDASGNHLNYTAASNTFSCGTSTSGLTTAGRSLTATGATVDADVALFTHTKSISIFNPTTTQTNMVQFYLPLAGTITRVACSTDVATSTVTIQFDERAEATPNTAGTNVMTASLVCDTDSQTTTTFDNATIAARVPVNLQITATANTPTVVRIHVEYTADD